MELRTLQKEVAKIRSFVLLLCWRHILPLLLLVVMGCQPQVQRDFNFKQSRSFRVYKRIILRTWQLQNFSVGEHNVSADMLSHSFVLRFRRDNIVEVRINHQLNREVSYQLRGTALLMDTPDMTSAQARIVVLNNRELVLKLESNNQPARMRFQSVD